MDTEAIAKEIEISGYCNVEDSVVLKEARAGREEYLSIFTSLPVHAPRERLLPESLASAPWRKLAIGSSNSVGEPYAQFLQTTYFGPSDARTPSLNRLFDRMIHIRNSALGVPIDFGEVPERDGFWNARRIHHYPSGGGYMMRHRDTHFPSALQGSAQPFLQMMVLLSEKGRDFDSGGGFVEDLAGNVVFPEDSHGVGSVIFFQEKTYHGVSDVDPEVVVDFESRRGRIAAFVNVYRVLS